MRFVEKLFPLGDPTERRFFIEPPHVNRPFDDLPRAAYREAEGRLDDGNGLEIDFRRIELVDGYLGLAGGATFLES